MGLSSKARHDYLFTLLLLLNLNMDAFDIGDDMDALSIPDEIDDDIDDGPYLALAMLHEANCLVPFDRNALLNPPRTPND